MGRRRRQLFTLANFSALPFLWLAFSSCQKKSDTSHPTSADSDMPQLKMTHLSLQSFGIGGLEWQLTAQTGEGYTDKNVLQVAPMKATTYRDGKKSTFVSADRGLLATGDVPLTWSAEGVSGSVLRKGDVYLKGNVVVVSTDGTHVETPWMHYQKMRDIVTSTAAVKVTRFDAVTTGTGFEARPDLSELRIFKQTLIIQEDAERRVGKAE